MHFRRISAYSLVALFAVLLLATGFSLAAATSGTSGYYGAFGIQVNSAQVIQTKQAGETVTIIRDIYGIPHINASTQEGAFFGHGYVQAEDGIELLMLNILTATGSLSSVFGPYEYNNTWEPGYKFRSQSLTNAESDVLIRQLRIAVSHSDYLRINETMRKIMVEPFAAGINYYIYTHWDSLPSWVKEAAPVTGEDIASTAAMINFLFSNQIITDWMKAEATLKAMNWNVTQYLETYQPGTDPHPPSSTGLGDSEIGSNEWVVNNTLSATGHPMLGGDPHLEFDGITQWHQAHLMAPAQGTLPELNIYGVMFYGVPFIGIGHNAYIAWSHTVNQPDLGDVWIERLNDANTMYYYNGSWVPLRQETISLPVKVEGLGVLHQSIPAYYTRHGVLLTINETAHWALAVNYSSNQNTEGLEQYYLMDTAQNLTQFMNAMSKLGLAMFNTMFASVYNETFYVWNAMCPKRNSSYDWRYAVPGWVTYTDWNITDGEIDMISFYDLPMQKDPTSGWMQNCNIPAWNITTQPNNITTTHDLNPFPVYLVDWNGYEGMSNHSRGYNMFYILDGLAPVGIDDMLGIAGNNSIYYAATDYIDKLPDNVYGEGNETLNDTIHLLKNWDKYATNQTAMTVFKIWSQNTDVPDNESHAISTLNDTINYMIDTYGNATDVYWGNVHYIVRGPYKVGLNGTSGGLGCLHPNYAMFNSTSGEWYCYGGESFQMVVNLEQGNVTSWSCLPYGNSNDPNSEHYADMLLNWYSKDQLHPDFFYMSDILANNESVSDVPVFSLDYMIWLLTGGPAIQAYLSLASLGQLLVNQSSAFNLMLGGIAGVLLLAVVAAVVFLSRKT
nr:penicillin acylase family protein [Candidatus Freyarchaeota archaeon]